MRKSSLTGFAVVVSLCWIWELTAVNSKPHQPEFVDDSSLVTPTGRALDGGTSIIGLMLLYVNYLFAKSIYHEVQGQGKSEAKVELTPRPLGINGNKIHRTVSEKVYYTIREKPGWTNGILGPKEYELVQEEKDENPKGKSDLAGNEPVNKFSDYWPTSRISTIQDRVQNIWKKKTELFSKFRGTFHKIHESLRDRLDFNGTTAAVKSYIADLNPKRKLLALGDMVGVTTPPEIVEESIGFVSSLNESGPIFKTIDSKGCGGIVVADKGQISYLSHPPKPDDKTTKCVWTVRGSRKGKVTFKLVSFGGELNPRRGHQSALITLTPFSAAVVKSLYKIPETKMIIMSGSPSDEYTLDGPIVFVTYIVKSGSRVPDFQLSFEAQGDDLESLRDKYFVHYHYDLTKGTVDYPEVRGAEEYFPNEVATFTINPTVTAGLLGFRTWRLNYLDIEDDAECNKDFLLFRSQSSGNSKEYYAVGPRYDNSKGECGNKDPELRSRGQIDYSDAPLIAIFVSDDKNEFKGFRFSWE